MFQIISVRLGQFASIAGIDQSDFGLLGNPQLSSTERRGQGDQAREERRESKAVSRNTRDQFNYMLIHYSYSYLSCCCTTQAMDIPEPVSGTPSGPPPINVDVSQTQPTQEVPSIPASVRRASPVLQEALDFDTHHSNPHRASGGSRSGNSVSSASIQSKSLRSNRSNGSERRVFSAVGSRASSLSQLASGRQSDSGSQRSSPGLVGF